MQNEIADLKGKVQHLESKVALLENQLARALDLLLQDTRDPESTIVKSRVILEKIVKNLYVKIGVELPKKKEELGGLLNNNQFTRHLPPRIVLRMNSVREYGNLGAHDKGPVTTSDAIDCLKCLVEILDWYCEEYLSSEDGRSSGGKEINVSSTGTEIARPTGLLLQKKHTKLKALALGSALVIVAIVAFIFLRHSFHNRNAILTTAQALPQELNQDIKAALQFAYTEKLEGSSPAAAIAIMVKYGSNDSEKWEVLQNGDKLSSSDNYRIMFCPETRAFFYVVQIDSTGKLDWLFPANAIAKFSAGENPVPAGLWTYVPGRDTAFHLDENIGTEHIYIIATGSRWHKLEEALLNAYRTKAKTVPVSRALHLRTRGVAGTRLVKQVPVGSSSLQQARDVRRLITGKEGILVYERWFQHVSAHQR